MSNTRGGNVIRVDTSAAFTDVRSIEGIKYIGNTNGTASIKKTDTNGAVLWEARGTSDTFDDVCLRSPTGIYVTVANSAVVYIYLR